MSAVGTLGIDFQNISVCEETDTGHLAMSVQPLGRNDR